MRRSRTIKTNMLIYSLSIIILMAILSTYTLSITNKYKLQLEKTVEKNILLTNIKELVNIIDESLLGYLSSKSSYSLNDYMIYIDELRAYKDKVELTYNEEDLMLRDIMNMIDSYSYEADLAIKYKRERNVYLYTEKYEEATQIKGYIFEYINELNNRQFYKNSSNYITLAKQIGIMQKISVLLIIDLILLAICIAYIMSYKMIKPIVKLSHSAEEISKGKFSIDDIEVESEDEFRVLAQAFNKMKNSTRRYIDELKLKAETEAKLKNEQMENLKMRHLLDNAKLYALQSQINPHFLFNTINAGVQMAMLEGADKTSEFLESMSSLFRYNIKQIDSEVTLNEEINNIKDYYKLLKTRFGELIRFEFIINRNTLNIKMPPLILQPLVENAYIHGLSEKEEGGTIIISTTEGKHYISIIVEDNGKGIAKKKIEAILNGTIKQDDENNGMGIGLRNVIDRLELYFHNKNIFNIESEMGKGTKIIINIPKRGVINDKAYNC